MLSATIHNEFFLAAEFYFRDAIDRFQKQYKDLVLKEKEKVLKGILQSG
jgi:hypothetical protein